MITPTTGSLIALSSEIKQRRGTLQKAYLCLIGASALTPTNPPSK